MRKKVKYYSFFKRTMFINLVFGIAITLVLSITIILNLKKFYLDKQFELVKNQHIQIHKYFMDKKNYMVASIINIYTNPILFQTIDLISNEKTENLSSQALFDISNILNFTLKQDMEISKVSIYNPKLSQIFTYDYEFNSVSNSPNSSVFIEEIKNIKDGITILPTREGYLENKMIYAICSNLKNSEVNNQSTIVTFEYNLKSILNERHPQFKSFYGSTYVYNNDNKLLFNSNDDYSGKNDFLLHNDKNNELVFLDNEYYYLLNYTDDNNEITVCTLISKNNALKEFRVATNLVLLVTIFILSILIIVYKYTSSYIKKKIDEILVAMDIIGLNNLSYRLPISNEQNELVLISTKLNSMCDILQENIDSSFGYQLRQKEAEMFMMQATINPHFLYNTLEIIRQDIYSAGNISSSEMLSSLAKVFRSMVKKELFILVGDELDLCDLLINMYKIRNSQNFIYNNYFETSLLKYGVIKGILQPIIENYFIHGFNSSFETNRLSICSYESLDFIYFVIWNNGNLVSDVKMDYINKKLIDRINEDSHFGISSVNDRVKNIYGEDCGLIFNSNEYGTTFTIKIKKMMKSELYKRIKI